MDILNDEILNTTAIYDYHPRSNQAMEAWFDTKEKANFPIIGAFNDNNQLLGFGTYGSFRNWQAYHYTLEHSLYVHKEARGKGIGKLLLKAIIDRAMTQNYHVLIGGIDSSNQVSIQLHEKFGFHHAGTIKQAGFKFNRWLDLSFYQLILNTPMAPMEA